MEMYGMGDDNARKARNRDGQSREAELDPPFEVLEPVEYRWAGGVQFPAQRARLSAGTSSIRAKLDLATLRRSEDSFVDELIAGVVPRGHPLVRVHFPRCYVDVNREPYELDPRMFEGACRRSPIRARCGSPAASARSRAWSATRRKSITSVFRSMMRCAASRALQALPSARCAVC
jgi:N-formylglutamate amidohydrolase